MQIKVHSRQTHMQGGAQGCSKDLGNDVGDTPAGAIDVG